MSAMSVCQCVRQAVHWVSSRCRDPLLPAATGPESNNLRVHLFPVWVSIGPLAIGSSLCCHAPPLICLPALARTIRIPDMVSHVLGQCSGLNLRNLPSHGPPGRLYKSWGWLRGERAVEPALVQAEEIGLPVTGQRRCPCPPRGCRQELSMGSERFIPPQSRSAGRSAARCATCSAGAHGLTTRGVLVALLVGALLERSATASAQLTRYE
eukprot:scaffold1628_cov407-Prasinococcus_capsulatus_cf.AAC.21